jgi:hypothetical protein
MFLRRGMISEEINKQFYSPKHKNELPFQVLVDIQKRDE